MITNVPRNQTNWTQIKIKQSHLVTKEFSLSFNFEHAKLIIQSSFLTSAAYNKNIVSLISHDAVSFHFFFNFKIFEHNFEAYQVQWDINMKSERESMRKKNNCLSQIYISIWQMKDKNDGRHEQRYCMTRWKQQQQKIHKSQNNVSFHPFAVELEGFFSLFFSSCALSLEIHLIFFYFLWKNKMSTHVSTTHREKIIEKKKNSK